MNIVAGIDFSKSSDALLRRAALYAARSGAALKLVHVVVEDDLSRYLSSNPGADRSRVMARADRQIRELVEGVDLEGVDYDLKIALGQPFKVLCDAVQPDGKDILMLSAHGEGKSVAGPTATRCVRRASADVLLVRDNHADAYRKILVCTDFSTSSRYALARAIEFVKVQGGEQIELVHVIYPPGRDFYGPTVQGYPDPSKSFRDNAHDGARARLEEFFSPFADEVDDLQVNFTVLESTAAAQKITTYVHTQGIDLVVLGTTGQGAIFGLKLGSNAERLLNAAPCSVLAVKRS